MAFSKVGELAFTVGVGAGTENKSLPGTLAENDIVLIATANDVSETLFGGDITTSGYNNIAFPNVGTPGHQVAWKRMGSTPDTVVNFNQTDVSPSAGIIRVYRGIAITTAIDNTPTVDNNTSGLPNPPTLVTLTDAALRIVIGLLDDDDAAAGTTAPATFTDVLAADTGAASTSVGATVMMASREEPTAGSLDPAAFGGSAGTDAWYAYHLAFRLGVNYPFQMTAGAFSGVVFGYGNNGANQFDTPFTAGSLDGEPLSGETLNYLFFGFAETIVFDGNVLAKVLGTTIWVDEVEYPFDLTDWTYDGGRDITYAEWDPGIGSGPTFVDTEVYEVQISNIGWVGGGGVGGLSIPIAAYHYFHHLGSMSN